MAEEKTNLAVTPDRTKPVKAYLRNSTGKSISSKEKTVPNYLRASTGSCHDMCKYGKGHSSEAKPWHATPRRAKPSSSDGQSSAESIVVVERKKKAEAKPEPCSDRKKLFSDNTPKTEHVVTSPAKKLDSTPKQTSSGSKETKSYVKPKRVSSSSSSEPSVGLILRGNTDSIVRKNAISNKGVEREKTGILSKGVKNVTTFPKSLNVRKSPVVKVTTPRISLDARKSQAVKILTPLKNQKRILKAEPAKPDEEEKVEEETKHVIKVESERQFVGPDQNETMITKESLSHDDEEEEEEESEEESEYTDSETEESYVENNGGIRINGGRKLKTADEDESGGPVKLKFRRGKVIDVQSETNGPRRLRFRRGRVLGENQNGKSDGRRRSFKKLQHDEEPNDGEMTSKKVVLKHQEVEEKKDGQGLFNNVIEETASKLVETRKSKVKALVGAFETVISLQESKPSANAVEN